MNDKNKDEWPCLICKIIIMRMIKAISAILITVCLLSCGNLKNISIDEVSESRMRKQSGSKVTIETRVKVNNPTGHKLVLRKVDAEILRKGYQFADVRLSKKVKIPAHSNDYHSVMLEFDVIDVMAVATGTVDLTQLDDNFTVSGFIKGGTALLCKKFKFNDVTMSQLDELLYNAQHGAN